MLRRIVCSLLGLCLVAGSRLAGAESANGGTESNLALGVGSRALALGGACLARVGDATAVYWNPAGLSDLARGSLVLMHAPIGYGQAAETFVGLAYPTLRWGSFGLGFVRLGTDGIRAYDAASNALGEIEYAESSVYLAYAVQPRLPSLGRSLSLGITLKTLTQSLTPWSSTSAGLDLGLQFMPARIPSLRFAAVLQDAVAPAPHLDQEADALPTTLRLAGSYRQAFGPNLELEYSAGVDRLATLGWSPRGGLEATYRGRLQLRAGVSRWGTAFGLGLTWQQFGLDYTYLNRADAATHPVSLSAAWGSTVEERFAAESAARASEVRAHLQSLLEARLATAQAAYDRGDYAAALDEWKVVSGLDPSEERAERGIEAASARLAAEQARNQADRSAAAARAAQFELGLRSYASSDYVQACNVWQQLVAADPQDAEAARYLTKSEEALRGQVRQQAEQARALEAEGDWVAALAVWTRVRLADAEHPEAEPGLARCRKALERPAAPSRPERSAVPPAVAKRSPAEAQYREALELYSGGEIARAVPLLREVRRLDPSNATAAELLAKAERQLQPLGAADRARVRELYLHGMGYFTAGEFEKAIADWTKILALDPGNTSVYQNIQEARARLAELHK